MPGSGDLKRSPSVPDIHLIYTSRCVSHLTALQFEELTQRAQHRNAELGITGVLLYGGGRFLQLLEGEPGAVRDLYFNRIAGDSRHTDLRILLESLCKERLFPNWRMGRLFLQETQGEHQQAWDALCAEIGKQNPAAVFARNPSVYCLNQFIEQFGEGSAPEFINPTPGRYRDGADDLVLNAP